MRRNSKDADFNSKTPREKILLTEKRKPRLNYDKAHINKLRMLCQKFLLQNETKLQIFGRIDKQCV